MNNRPSNTASLLTAILAIASPLTLIPTGDARADQAEPATFQFKIPVQSVSQALQVFSAQSGLQIVYHTDVLVNASANKVDGMFDAQTALDRLLSGTHLKALPVNARTFAIEPESHDQPSETGQSPQALLDRGVRQDSSGSDGDSPSSSSQRLQLAQADRPPTPAASLLRGASNEPASENPLRLEEVVVTAQKREERLQDVPVAVTVLNPETLAENGQSRLVDYFATVPGLNVSGAAFNGGTQYITIRGLSAGFSQNPTVATVIDDVPVGSSQFNANGNFTSPDLDPSDLARVEVLKGPQGTLYGADSLGGLIKYVTLDPSTSAFSSRVETTGVDIPEGGAGYAVRAAANIPVSDTFAIRVSGFTRHDPGYIDDLTSGQSNVNSVDVYGGHFAALYRPSDSLSFKLSALIQNSDGNGPSYVNSDSMQHFLQGDLKVTGLPSANPWSSRWQLYTANVNAKVAGVDITSTTGYGTNRLSNRADFTALSYFSDPANYYFPGSTGVLSRYDYYTEKLTQEIRLSSSVQKWFDWLAGAFYTHEVTPGSTPTQWLQAANPTTGAVAGTIANYYYPTTFKEGALFADLTFHLTDRFDIQLGGRQSWDRMIYAPVYSGLAIYQLYGVTSPYVLATGRASGDPFTYLITPKFTISRNLQIYGRIASGYRIGGPNLNYGAGPLAQGIPQTYQPDKTINYELGIKGDFYEHRLSIEAAAYYIKWNNFQLALNNASDTFYIANAGDAKSEGLEFSAEAHPIEGLTLAIQGSFSNAVLTQDLPPSALGASGAYGLAGDRLPYSIRASGGLTVNQDIRFPGGWIGFVGGAATYIGRRPWEFAPTEQSRVWLPGYTQVNLRTGVRYQSWVVNFFVNNVANKRGIESFFGYEIAEGDTGGAQTVVTQPRTLGLSISKSF